MAAYADGGFTLEQAMCVAYERASRAVQAVQQTGVPGLMAAVGLSEESCTTRLCSRGLSSVDVACDNSASNLTISGTCATPNSSRPWLDAISHSLVLRRFQPDMSDKM